MLFCCVAEEKKENRLPVVMRGPQGCRDGEPRPCGEIAFWRRTAFKERAPVDRLQRAEAAFLIELRENIKKKTKMKLYHCSATLLLVAVSCIT